MRLLLLLPVLTLLCISAYNLFTEFTVSGGANYLVLKLLHSLVFLLSLIITYFVIKPLFTKYNKPLAKPQEYIRYIMAVK